jgi:aminoglycoside 2'-N-acetyltransferase I
MKQPTRDAVCRLCIEAHQMPGFCRLFYYLPSDGLHVLAYKGRTLVGHALVTTRWLQPENLPVLRTGYVDAVATSPAYQGQGIGSAVMQQLAAGIADDYEIACLETERESFYARLGWETWRGSLAGRGEDGLVPTPKQTGVMILRLPRTPPLNLDSLLTIECQSARIW